MTELTRARIEAIKNGAPRIDESEIVALCDLATKALEMRPRPLAEIDKTDAALVIHRDESEALYLHNVFVLRCYGSGVWKTGAINKSWPDTTLATPLSSLPKVTP